MTLAIPQDPRFGSQLSASEFRNRVINPLNANDATLEARIAALEQALALLPMDYRQPTVPNSAKFRDRWIDPSDNEQQYFCAETYGASEGDKIHKWIALGDSSARATATQAVNTAGLATRTIIAETPPDACERGWTWTDTSSLNRDMRCTESYAETDGPDGYPSLELFRISKFTPVDTYVGSLLAAAEQGLKDGKSNTLFQDTVPEWADGRDIWIDTNDNFGAFVCKFPYRVTDHSPYDSGKVYVEDEIVTYLGSMYQAKVGGSPGGNVPSNAIYWTLLGQEYSDITLFRESCWEPTSDPVSRAIAMSAKGIADGKSKTSWSFDYPDEADYSDIYVNRNTSQAYICKQAYNADTVLPEDRSEMWEAIADTVARDAAEAKDAIMDGVINTYLQPTIPTAAGVKDLWFNTAEQYQAYVCIASYAVGGDMTFWKPLVDKSKTSTYQVPTMPDTANLGDTWVQTHEKQFVCIQSYATGTGIMDVNWQPVNDSFRAVYYLPDPPPAAQKGDGWMDTVTPTGQYQFYVCKEDYSNSEHGWVSLEEPGKWSPSRDANASKTATLALNVANSKTTTFYQDDRPLAAKQGDQWVDTNDTYLDTKLNKSYICVESYAEGTNPEGKWTEYADPVAQQTALEAKSIADKKRKIVYNASTPDASEYDGFDVGDGWLDSDDNIFYVCIEAHSTGAIFSKWQETANATADEALRLAHEAKAVKDGLRQTYTTAGQGDGFWPGPGSANQWPIANWVEPGAQIGDVWFHKNTTTGQFITRHCVTAYSGYANGDMGSMAHWQTFTDPNMVSNFAGSIAAVENSLNSSISSLGSATSASLNTKMDKAGGTFTGAVAFGEAVSFIASQSFEGSSMTLAGGATVNGALTANSAPSANNHVVRKVELDAEASEREFAKNKADVANTRAVAAQDTANMALWEAAVAQSTANTAVSNAATAQSTADSAVSGVNSINDSFTARWNAVAIARHSDRLPSAFMLTGSGTWWVGSIVTGWAVHLIVILVGGGNSGFGGSSSTGGPGGQGGNSGKVRVCQFWVMPNSSFVYSCGAGGMAPQGATGLAGVPGTPTTITWNDPASLGSHSSDDGIYNDGGLPGQVPIGKTGMGGLGGQIITSPSTNSGGAGAGAPMPYLFPFKREDFSTLFIGGGVDPIGAAGNANNAGFGGGGGGGSHRVDQNLSRAGNNGGNGAIFILPFVST
jgi:hypothetical protein